MNTVFFLSFWEVKELIGCRGRNHCPKIHLEANFLFVFLYIITHHAKRIYLCVFIILIATFNVWNRMILFVHHNIIWVLQPLQNGKLKHSWYCYNTCNLPRRCHLNFYMNSLNFSLHLYRSVSHERFLHAEFIRSISKNIFNFLCVFTYR